MSEGDKERLSPGEDHFHQEILITQWALNRFLLEWKALYAGLGEAPSDYQLYLDAKEVVASDESTDILPEIPYKEKRQRAFLFLHAVERLSNTLDIAVADLLYNRGPHVLRRLEELAPRESARERVASFHQTYSPRA